MSVFSETRPCRYGLSMPLSFAGSGEPTFLTIESRCNLSNYDPTSFARIRAARDAFVKSGRGNRERKPFGKAALRVSAPDRFFRSHDLPKERFI